MPRGRAKAVLSIADLQSLLKQRDEELQVLAKRRKEIVAELAGLDKLIHALKGGKGAAAPKVARKAVARRGRRAGGPTLPAVISQVLSAAGGPMRLKDIAQAAQAAGYKSASKDFYNVVSQTLHTRPEFNNVARGVYALAPAGEAEPKKAKRGRKPRAAKKA